MVTLPNPKMARIAADKIEKYLLNTTSMDGAAKCRFLQSFGFDPNEPDVLRRALLTHSLVAEVIKLRPTQYGFKVELHGTLNSPDGRNPTGVTTIWAFEPESVAPKFITLLPR